MYEHMEEMALGQFIYIVMFEGFLLTRNNIKFKEGK